MHRPLRPRRPRPAPAARALLLLLPLLLLPAAACDRGTSGSERSTEDRVEHMEARPQAEPAPGVVPGAAVQRSGSELPARAPDEALRAPTAAAPDSSPGAAAAPVMLIRTGDAVVEVDSLEAAIAAVQRLAAGVGGYIASTRMELGREQVRSATLQLRLPAARWDAAVGGLRGIGRVERVDVRAEDVGEEYVDLGARLDNARRFEQRMLELLERRTGRLEDVLAVERELARIREEIERYEGRRRFLQTRAALSTLQLTVHEPFPLAGAPGQNPLGEAFRDAWRNFVGFVTGLIALLGVLLPLGGLLLLALWALRPLWRRWRRR